MLPVYYQSRLVGQIEQAKPGLTFAYDSVWQAAPDAFAISRTMPLRKEPYSSDIATPWFANLLPEDRQLELIGRLLGRSQGDVYGILEEIGGETAGALSIGRPELVENAAYRALSESALAEIIKQLPSRPLLAGQPEVTLSLAGAQTKITLSVFDNRLHLPLRGAASTHILKPASERLYASVENEVFCMTLAARIGLRAAAVAVGVADGQRYLLVERYDRQVISASHVNRNHQEDFCQALGIYLMAKYQASGGPSLADLFRRD